MSYPKFKLSQREISAILNDEVLPYIEPVEITNPQNGICRDDKFLSAAVCGNTSYQITGDQDLLALVSHETVQILTVTDFLHVIVG